MGLGVPERDDTTYAFQNVRAVQRERLGALEEVLDAGTVRQLDSLGVGRGWRCLEVGAGGGSIAAWLCDRVAPDGAVVATDLDTTVLRELSRPNLEIRVHDVLEDELEEGEFDLVHLRLLLAWLSEPQTALQRLAAALKPGGWLLAEEMDFASVAADPRVDADAESVFTRVVAAHNAVLAGQHTFDVHYGRRVAGDLADAGLADVACEGRASVWRGGQPGGTVWRLTFTQLREPLMASGLVTSADIDDAIALCDDPAFAFVSQITMAACGRRPTGD
jgi:SAM-dependent methyltransferase